MKFCLDLRPRSHLKRSGFIKTHIGIAYNLPKQRLGLYTIPRLIFRGNKNAKFCLFGGRNGAIWRNLVQHLWWIEVLSTSGRVRSTHSKSSDKISPGKLTWRCSVINKSAVWSRDSRYTTSVEGHGSKVKATVWRNVSAVETL